MLTSGVKARQHRLRSSVQKRRTKIICGKNAAAEIQPVILFLEDFLSVPIQPSLVWVYHPEMAVISSRHC